MCGESGKTLTRGLCPAHHALYLRTRKTAADPEALDRHLISVGLLLPSRQGRRLSPDENPFLVALAELEGLPSPEAAHHKAKKAARKPADEAAADLVEQAGEIAKELDEQSSDEQTAKKTTRKSKAGGRPKKK